MHPADIDALRIWQLPPADWKAEVDKLPEHKVINGVTWPYRIAVQERLRIAFRAKKVGVYFYGWSGVE